MSTGSIVYVLTGLAAVVVVLTRARMRRAADAAGRHDIARGPIALHTGAGALALVLWVVFLFADDVRSGTLSESTRSLVGVAALFCWWMTAGAGLLILLRWLPSRGRHAADGVEDSWSSGPGLSLLGHLGMVVGVAVFTYAYLVSAV